jgi:uncharacterized protein YdeI (YjbR/CyaY-like superfamily)
VSSETEIIEILYAPDALAWMTWLEANHLASKRIWLMQHRKLNPQPCVGYEDAVREALCFGWIDSKPQKLDQLHYLLLFTQRKPKSPWSASNKKRVDELMRSRRMKPAGLASIELAKKNGSWSLIDEAESFIMPADLEQAFSENRQAFAFFDAFPPSAKRGIYTWISLAKTEATRRKRIEETVRLASENIRANQWKPKQ